jgi:hypothetical protein
MAEPTPFAITQLFGGLVGRNVTVTQVTKYLPNKVKQMYGTYLVKPMDSTRIVQADLPLLGSLAGCLLGLPSDAVKERVGAAEIEEGFRDAIHEVLNIASTIVSTEYRAVFQKMFADPVYLPSEAADTFKDPVYRNYFTIKVDGYEGGNFNILAPL